MKNDNDGIAEKLNNQDVAKCEARNSKVLTPFNLDEEISKRRVFKAIASNNIVRLQ